MQIYLASAGSTLAGIAQSVSFIWSHIWWLVLPLVAFFVFLDFWRIHEAVEKLRKIEWILLEIKIPKNILKTPKSMEQIFSSLHAAEKSWLSLEMVGRGGDSHFYMRMPKEFKHLAESAIYAQYPETEINQIRDEDDYMKIMPRNLPNERFDLHGSELVLKQKSPYPIRTYPAFEETDEERLVDPIAALTEAMAKLTADQQIWIQILIKPADDKWKKEGEELIDELMGKKKEKTPIIFPGFTLKEAVLAPMEHPSLEVQKKEEKSPNLASGKKNIIEAIEEKIAKLGFETAIRFVYLDQRETFGRENVVSVLGTFRQYNTQNLNSFVINKKVETGKMEGLFKDLRLLWRKKAIYDRYRMFLTPHKPYILNTEELATIYHFPAGGVLAPSLGRIESKKGGPPTSIPLVE
jgi:hypothetical protein